jgi:hypothetical protein
MSERCVIDPARYDAVVFDLERRDHRYGCRPRARVWRRLFDEYAAARAAAG